MRLPSHCSLAIVICFLSWVAWAPADERESFEAILKQATRPYGLDFKLSENLPDWEGLSTKQGIEVLVHDLMFTDTKTVADDARRELCRLMLEHARFSKSSLAAYIQELAVAAADDANLMARYMFLLDETGCSDEPGIVPFWASYLSDTRNVETKPRHPESQLGEYVRVCDSANACLRRYLLKKKLWMPGDPGYGDAGGETMWDARDKGIDALNGVLLKNKLITVAVRPAPRGPNSTPGPGNENPTRLPHPEPIASVATAQPREPAGESYWWLWTAGVLAVLALGWMIFRRGK